METIDFITPDLFKEIYEFEAFLKKIGFKRVEGSIFGLLVLSSRPLRSEEIENILTLSQSAVSQAIKNLSHFGAIETRETLGPKDRRIQTHSAKEDAISIVSTVFRKREQEAIEQFKASVQRAYSQVAVENQKDQRLNRFKSIIMTCDLAESVMALVINLAQKQNLEYYEDMIKKFPKVIDFILNGPELVDGIKSNIGNRIKEGLSRLAERN